jgi:hypothetical protein
LRAFAWVTATFQPSLFDRHSLIHFKEINFRSDDASSLLHRSHAFASDSALETKGFDPDGREGVIEVTKVTVNQVVPSAGIVKGS